MKTTLSCVLIVLFALLTVSASAQKLQKGNLVGIHIYTVELKEGVTMDQVISFTKDTFLPATDKAFKGVRGYLAKGIRGTQLNQNQIGIIWIYPSEAIRDRYFNPDGQPTALGQQAIDKMAGLLAERDKLATVRSEYTDWVVQ